ncbi:MAG: hypothetical protein KC917_06290 [Candidatus Omnitrophica bacterium]|nr:hypothetical protein [Candidatus Omnitrophota bacterium]MCB9768071.1 hypothetical protein [Candidatus Omnitrophota bacterium]
MKDHLRNALHQVPRFVYLLLFILVLGCSPKEEETTSPAPDRKPSPTPAGKPFVILSDATDSDQRVLAGCVEKSTPLGETYFYRWEKPSESEGRWDIALVRPWTVSSLEANAVDLLPHLEEAYPKYKHDLFVPVDDLVDEATRLLSFPIVLAPEFLFAMNHPQWNFQFSKEIFDKEIAEGAKVGLVESPLADFYRESLGIPESQTVAIDFRNPDNPFSKGEIEFAIGPKGWLLEKQVQGLSVISLAEAGLTGAIPDAGYRAIVAKDCVDLEIAEKIFANLVTEGQLCLVGVPDSFPIRRSIYASPRVQGPLTAFYKKAFDQTLSNLDGKPFSE